MFGITIPPWVRSLLITAVTAFALAITATDFQWSKSALIAALLAAVRTALSAVLPGGAFGFGSDPGPGA